MTIKNNHSFRLFSFLPTVVKAGLICIKNRTAILMTEVSRVVALKVKTQMLKNRNFFYSHNTKAVIIKRVQQDIDTI